MIELLCSILCSVSVGILFKIIRKNKKINFFHIIACNYLFASILSYWFYSPNISFILNSIQKSKNFPYYIFIPIVFLLPSIFKIQALSIKYSGIVKTDIAQRFSLIISLLAAYFIFNENFSNLKIIGLSIGLISIFLVFFNKHYTKSSNYFYPIIVLLGFGIIDIFFKQISYFKDLPYTYSLFLIFCGSFVICFIIILFGLFFKKSKFNLINIGWGVTIGILNFGNILFYLKAHSILRDSPSIVFAGMNLGVIILGSAVGIFFFKEKINKTNYIGIFLSFIAIIIISISQILK